MKEDKDRADRHPRQAELPPNGNGIYAPTRGTSINTGAEKLTTSRAIPPTVVTHLTFGNPNPPTILDKARGGTTTCIINTFEHQNIFTPLREQGIASGGNDSEAPSSRLLGEGSTSATSSSRGRRDKDPTPLTSEILLLLDRLEPDKGKHARLLTEHLIGQITFPCTEKEL